jgi:SAM-dependent methyltransferase
MKSPQSGIQELAFHVLDGDHLMSRKEPIEVTSLVRKAYDDLAEEYSRHLFNELQSKPLDCALLDRFAQHVRGRGKVCDLGCGPGQVARYLSEQGVDVFGIDLSERMIKIARQLSPDVAFHTGNMFSLKLRNDSLAGIAAYYAIVNIPRELLSPAFEEIARVLQPQGVLLLSFHIGDKVLHVDELWGQRTSLDFVFFEPSEIRQALEAAGFAIEEIVERDPYPDVEYQSRRAYIFARRG